MGRARAVLAARVDFRKVRRFKDIVGSPFRVRGSG
jgi:hypothetical protein